MFSHGNRGTFFKNNKKIVVNFNANSVEKKRLDIPQLTSGPIINDHSDNSETVSNPDLIDGEAFSKKLLP